jgi:hypothetical protein
MLKTRPNYQKLASFRQAHPAVVVPGDGFFSNKTQAELQEIIDQTLTSLKKKREITGPVGQAAAIAAAEALLKAAGSADKAHTVYVRWGIHQAVAGVARGGGAITMNHFSVEDPGGGNDWHLYVDKGEATIIEMTQNPAVVMRIENA